jgi:two-component system, NtrC family, sensor kinase
MTKEMPIRFVATVLALTTVAAAIFGWINFRKERQYAVPSDGVNWIEHDSRLVAEHVDPNGPGEKAGIKVGDVLLAINGEPVQSFATATRLIYRAGVWSNPKYSLYRNGYSGIDATVYLIPVDYSFHDALRFISLVYFGIGLYVLLRRWTAPKSLHFYIFCLVSFIAYAFHYTGKLNAFDQIVMWSNYVAWGLQPALFLHFALTFPEKHRWAAKHTWRPALVYIPGALVIATYVVAVLQLEPSGRLRWNLERIQWSYMATFFVIAACILWQSYRDARTPILRQQMKWVTRGTILAIAPFTLFYVLPYVFGALPTEWMKASVLSLVILPLTFGYAIFRYRLMDVDIIFKRGMAYTLAAASIAGLYFAAVAGAAEIIHTRLPSAGSAGLIIAIVITALLFDPVKNWIQEHLDRFFYKKRYDYRRTLIEFGRELSAETDLNKMMNAVVDRLSRTLLVDRVAVFLKENGQFVIGNSSGIGDLLGLDLRFLDAPRPEPASHLFFDNTHQAVRETPQAQEAISRLDLNYYIPCKAQQQTIAVLGLGKTAEGDFLNSEDVELLETLAGYIAIAIQNARLYASLEQKMLEYERLKDFNENIVESISVGVLAVDLQDRVEFWNSQLEVMYALPRSEALGRPLSEVFPADFAEQFKRLSQTAGIHNLYKFRLNTRSGELRITNIAIAPLVTRHFSVIGRLIIVDDITERIELESQLTQAEKLSSIGLLAAGVAHEVNTPLAVISSYAQMLTKQVHGDAKQSALLDKITQQTFRASEIVNNLLNFSRTAVSEFTEVDLNKIIQETLTLLEHQFKTAKVKVEREFSPELPLIHGNVGKLQQVFLNLFLNAKDAMPGGGTLSVATQNGYGVNVVVRDSGSGIAQEHIRRIYDPFFTTKTLPREGQGRGTGLGLAVTYGIIQEHAGKIHVESQAGHGTTFFLEFPLVGKAVNA